MEYTDTRCKICGRQSYGWDLCRDCNTLKKEGYVVHTRTGWKKVLPGQIVEDDAIYERNTQLVTWTELQFYRVIKESLGEGYFVFPQVGLSAVINRSDSKRYKGELYRVLDFLITDTGYVPQLAIEINDDSHKTNERKQRDLRLKEICEEAGLPLIFFQVNYGINQEYIRSKIIGVLSGSAVFERRVYTKKIRYESVAPVEESTIPEQQLQMNVPNTIPKKKKFCAPFLAKLFFIVTWALLLVFSLIHINIYAIGYLLLCFLIFILLLKRI